MEGLEAFFEQGGWVLTPIFVVTALSWMLILERTYYLRFVHPKLVDNLRARWLSRAERISWGAQQIRNMYIGQGVEKAQAGVAMIKTLTAVCPLLGLLGTVTGMIEVFDVMALAGNGNPRAMAAGVSKATLPTMAGMVAALSTVYFATRLGRAAERARRRLERALPREVGHA
jgi:biopolymer transport protein ExbB